MTSSCPFCNIAEAYPPTNPSSSASPSDSDLNDHERVSPSAFVVLSTPLCMAFLDIMPLSPGHMLVTTRRHHEKISDVSEEESRELGLWLPRLSRVLATVTGVWDVSLSGLDCLHCMVYWKVRLDRCAGKTLLEHHVVFAPDVLSFRYQAHADSGGFQWNIVQNNGMFP